MLCVRIYSISVSVQLWPKGRAKNPVFVHLCIFLSQTACPSYIYILCTYPVLDVKYASKQKFMIETKICDKAHKQGFTVHNAIQYNLQDNLSLRNSFKLYN